MPYIGSEVLVMSSLGENVAVPLGNVNVGDSVILYPLKDNTRIAVPTLSLSLGSVVFNTPSFNFGGFNWSIDFNFQLIPLDLSLFGADVIFLWNQVEYQATHANPHGCGEIWLEEPGQGYVRKSVPFGYKYGYKYCAIKCNGDYNDGVAKFYINDILVDSVCMYMKGVRWYTYSMYDIGMKRIKKIEMRSAGEICGGSDSDVAFIAFAFYNDPEFELP